MFHDSAMFCFLEDHSNGFRFNALATQERNQVPAAPADAFFAQLGNVRLNIEQAIQYAPESLMLPYLLGFVDGIAAALAGT